MSDAASCEISDALIRLGSPHGGHIPDLRPVTPPYTLPIAGPAYTVQFEFSDANDAPMLPTHFLDSAPKHSVIVVDAPPHAKNAVWGGLMTAAAQARGVVGVVISGRCRDLAEHRAAAFPVFARGHSTLGQSPFVRPSAINVPLVIHPHGPGTFPPVTVEPDDWIVADEDGVVCVPKHMVNEVLELASIAREADAKVLEDIKAGKGIQASFKLHRGR